MQPKHLHLCWDLERGWWECSSFQLSTSWQKLQCLSTLETQTIRFSHCSFAAFSLMCELWSLLKKHCFLVVLLLLFYYFLFIFYYFVSVYYTDNRALVRYIKAGLPILQIFLKLMSQKSWELPTSYDVNFYQLGVHAKYKFELEYSISSNSLIQHFTKMDVTITWPMKSRGFYFGESRRRKN